MEGRLSFLLVMPEYTHNLNKEDFKVKDVTLDDILSCDAWAREYVAENTKNIVKAPVIIL